MTRAASPPVPGPQRRGPAPGQDRASPTMVPGDRPETPMHHSWQRYADEHIRTVDTMSAVLLFAMFPSSAAS
ncbi:hypothetical protein ACRAWF_21470 [Streptomyces sp. L7]